MGKQFQARPPKTMLILIDQDNVIADFNGGVASEWSRIYPDLAPIDFENHTSQEITDNIDEIFHDKVRTIYRSAGFFRNLKPIPGAVEAIKHLTELGHEVFICTAPISVFENCVLEKYLWVEEHLGREWTKRLILTKDKTLIKGDILIDDKPEITGAAQPSWKQILYDQPYNRQITNLKRLNWDNYLEVLGIEKGPE